MAVQYGGFSVLSSPFFIEGLLPFLLIFSVIFGILQKSQIFGEGKKQTDALIAFSTGLIVVAFANAINIIVQLLSFMAVAVVVILIFMILTGFLFKAGDFDLDKKVKVGFGILIFIAVVIATIVYTGGWDWLEETFSGSGSSIITNALFIAIIVGAVIWVGFSGGSGAPKPGKS